MIDIRMLIPYARNSRRHSESQISKLAAVIDDFGFTSPLITVGNELKAGHGRLEAVQRILSGGGHIYPAPGRKNGAQPFTDWFLPNIDATGWSDNQARAYVIAENRMAELAEWDNELLALELEDLRLADFDLNLTGFDSAALDSIMDDAGNKNENAGEYTEPQNDRAKELREKYGVESGQVWQLGDHRLACGDCTDIEVVKLAMGGDKARLCFTSPPYDAQRTYEIGAFDWLQLANGFADCVFQILADPADFVVNLGMSYKDGRVNFYWDKWLRENEAKGRWLYGWYVWDKIAGAYGEFNGRLATSHEFLFHFSQGRVSANKWIETKYTEESAAIDRERKAKGGRQGTRNIDGSIKKLSSIDAIGQSHRIPYSVVSVMSEKARGLHTETHPAVFPVELPEFMMQTWSNPGDIVYEPFCGSGTSIIAAQNLGRKCRAVELSPNYCAVILERFKQHTGIEPVLL